MRGGGFMGAEVQLKFHICVSIKMHVLRLAIFFGHRCRARRWSSNQWLSPCFATLFDNGLWRIIILQQRIVVFEHANDGA